MLLQESSPHEVLRILRQSAVPSMQGMPVMQALCLGFGAKLCSPGFLLDLRKGCLHLAARPAHR